MIIPAISREFAMPRSRLSTSIGVSVPAVASTNTSAVPRATNVPRTMAMLTCPVAITAHRTARTSPRTTLAAMITRRRSSRSASAPATSPNTSQGTCSANMADDTSSGLRVCEATSSGAAAMSIPSPRLVTHDEPTSQRNPVPRRAGKTVSTMRVTSR